MALRVLFLFVLPSVCSIRRWEWCRTGWESHPGCNTRSCLRGPLYTENTSSSSVITITTTSCSRLDAVSSGHVSVPSVIKISPERLKEVTFTNPHLRRWDWSSERRRGPKASASYRAGCRKDRRSALLPLTARFLQKPCEESSVSSSDRKSGALCPFFLKLWNHTPTTRPSSTHRSSSETLVKTLHSSVRSDPVFQHE